MATIDLSNGWSAGSGNALKDLLENSTIYEKAGSVIPTDLLQFGIYGAVIVIATGVLALLLPSPVSISHGGFFLVLGGTAGGLDALMQGLAIPAIVSGAALLLVDAYLMVMPTSEEWRWAVIAQAAVGGVGGFLGVLFLALVVLNLALWIAIVCCVLALFVLILGAMG